jgi:hypothetical protein
MTAIARHPAGHATYNGNVEHMVGEVVGPTTYGTLVIATDAHYDRETGYTIVDFGFLTDDEMAQLAELAGA